jgi:hypothetical protein
MSSILLTAPAVEPLSLADTMVRAHDGAATAEVALAPWGRRRLAYAFQFPGVDAA